MVILLDVDPTIIVNEIPEDGELKKDASRAARLRDRRDLVGRFKKRLSASASSTPFGRSASSLAPSISVTGPDGQEVKRGPLARINNQFDKLITGIRSISADRASSRNRGT